MSSQYPSGNPSPLEPREDNSLPGYSGLPTNEPHYFVPAGMPPGHEPLAQDEGAPAGVQYFRIFGGFMALCSGALLLAGMIGTIAALASASGPASGSSGVPEIVGGLIYTAIGGLMFLSYIIALFGGRRPWVHTLGTILIALTMTSICCMPISIPLLIAYNKQEVKRWYGN